MRASIKGETTTVEEKGTSQGEYTSKEKKEENKLLGSWYSDAEGVVVVFSEQGKMETYIIECEYNENPTVEILTEQYDLLEDSKLETYCLDGSLNVIYNYSINEDVLSLSLDSSDYSDSIILNKVKRSTLSDNPLVGQWKLLSMGSWIHPAINSGNMT